MGSPSRRFWWHLPSNSWLHMKNANIQDEIFFRLPLISCIPREIIIVVYLSPPRSPFQPGFLFLYLCRIFVYLSSIFSYLRSIFLVSVQYLSCICEASFLYRAVSADFINKSISGLKSPDLVQYEQKQACWSAHFISFCPNFQTHELKVWIV